MIAWILVLVACGIMFLASKSRSYPREARAKFVAFVLVAAVVGLLLIYKSYNWVGTFWGIRQSGALVGSSAVVGSVGDLTLSKPHYAQDDFFYGIMIDAGSTGSRIHAMKFQSIGPGKPLKFIDDKFIFTKPGLSSFANDPEKGAHSLVTLLEEVKLYIPKELHSTTPIALKATAGLRLLPADQSRDLLNSVKALLKKYSFRVFDDSVEIMGGTDEGIFSWFTMNFFLEAMGNINQTLGVMDLGGGSTQVTFIPKEQGTITGPSSKFLTDFDIFGTKHKIYSHSYLGLGLMSARLAILGGKEGNNGGILQHACFAPGSEKKWTYVGKDYTVKGLPEAGDRFTNCYQAATSFLEGRIQHVKEIEDDFFCTISYYFDKAVDYGLIGKGTEGKNLTVDEFFGAASMECKKLHPVKPFLCFDLTYISALLHNGFGFKKNTTLMVIKHVHGREISWALGAMFNYFNKHHIRDS